MVREDGERPAVTSCPDHPEDTAGWSGFRVTTKEHAMVDNQHRQIPGYRDLNQDEVDTIRNCKDMESTLVAKPESPWTRA